MTTQRLVSRIQVPEKVKTELFFVGQCILGGAILLMVVNFAVGN